MARSIPCSLTGSLDGRARVAASRTAIPPDAADLAAALADQIAFAAPVADAAASLADTPPPAAAAAAAAAASGDLGVGGGGGRSEVTWQIVVGAIAGVIPFIVASIEFGKRIAAQRRCEAYQGSGLQLVGRFYRRCSAC
ncbi:unnamed protein product, partial [Closterium sp. Naga37s-1]